MMKQHRAPRAAGFPFLVVGIAFLAIALASDQAAFIGAGMAFITLGILLLAKARRSGDA